jgi:hypothetical protein
MTAAAIRVPCGMKHAPFVVPSLTAQDGFKSYKVKYFDEVFFLIFDLVLLVGKP